MVYLSPNTEKQCFGQGHKAGAIIAYNYSTIIVFWVEYKDLSASENILTQVGSAIF